MLGCCKSQNFHRQQTQELQMAVYTSASKVGILHLLGALRKESKWKRVILAQRMLKLEHRRSIPTSTADCWPPV